MTFGLQVRAPEIPRSEREHTTCGRYPVPDWQTEEAIT